MTRPLRWALLLGALGYLLQLRFTIDDAAISFAYATRWAHGHPLGVIVPGGARVEGYSNFSWVVLLAAGEKLGASALTTAKVLGLACGLGTIVVVHRIAEPVLRHRSSRWALLALPVSFGWAFWAASGLENALYGFLLVLAALLLVRRRLAAAALVVVAICLTRPDGIAYAVASAALVFVDAWSAPPVERRRQLGRAVAWCGAVAGGFGAYLAWHYRTYATLLPNTSYAKLGQPGVGRAAGRLTDPTSSGWTYVGGWLWHHGALFLLPLVAVGIAVVVTRRERVVAVFAATTLLLPLYQADWMVHYRFLSYAAPLAVTLAAFGLDRVWVLARWRAIAVVTLVLYAAVNVHLDLHVARRGYEGYVTMAEIEAFYATLADDAARAGLPDPLYFLGDLGATTYRLDMRVLDSIGLGDYHVAHSHWDRRVLEQYVFVERRPTFISTHDKWTRKYRLLDDPELARDYLRIPFAGGPPGYLRFVRRDALIEPVATASGNDGTVSASTALELLRTTAPRQWAPGRAIPFDTWWAAGAAPTATATQVVRVIATDGAVVAERAAELGYGWYPTGDWRAGEAFRQHVTLPPLPAGSYRVDIASSGDGPRVSVALDVGDRAAAELGDAALASGDTEALTRALEARPGDARLVAARARARAHAMDALLTRARDALARHDLAAVVQTVDAAAVARGRAEPDAAWRALEHRLRRAGAATTDRRARYALMRAAWTADPLDVWAQRDLDIARRAAF